MKRKLLSLLLLSIMFCAAVLPSGVVFAQQAGQQQGEQINQKVTETFAQGAVKIFSTLLAAAVLLSALVVAFGAILYIIAFLKGGLREQGTEWIKAGLTGLFIVMTSWIVLNTVNPDLFKFTWRDIPKLLAGESVGGGGSGAAAPIVYYDEIPLGKLTENLLTGTMDCYDFDSAGNPIPGNPIKNDSGAVFLPPTYLNHDRADCYLKLADAVEKKTLAAENLAEEISKLMATCSCEGKCDSPCNENGLGCANPPFGTSCENNTCGNPSTAACTPGSGLKNAYLNNEPSLQCCPDNVKNQIRGYLKQHGDGPNYPPKKGSDPTKVVQPFVIGIKEECTENCVDPYPQIYYGLDEFYSNKNRVTGQPVEQETKVAKRDVTYIDLGTCGSCAGTCGECKPDDKSCLKDQQECQVNKQKCLTARQQCLEQTPWGKLNLREQITYLDNKMDEIKLAIQKDSKAVQAASQKIASCPLVKSSVDFVQTDEYVDKKQAVIMAKRDPQIKSQDYCNGYAYANSTCQQSCTEACPITQDSLKCFAECNSQQCNPKDKDYQECLQKKDQCTSNCYNNRSCEYAPQFKNYGQCMSSCQDSCTDYCGLRYLECSPEYQACTNSCTSDSQCLSENLTSCLINPSSLSNCSILAANGASDEQVQQCINGSATCPYGSMQNSGYPECLKNPASQDEYSASYIWENKNDLVCPDPFALRYYDNSGLPTTCVQANPETQKCPATPGYPNVTCPTCQCDAIETSLRFFRENPVTVQEANVCGGISAPIWPETTCSSDDTNENVTVFQAVAPTCADPAFNGDPLTFYCRQDWWNEPETKRAQNLGKSEDPRKTLTCSRANEIPIGTATDGAVTWVDEFTEQADKISLAVQKFLDNIQSTITNASGYCSCNSKYQATGNPVCRACCNFVSGQPIYDENGDLVDYTPDSCSFQACSGNSCQQMINWLQETINWHSDIKKALFDLTFYLAKQPRSDLLKQLTYARNQTNSCSVASTANGKNNTRLLNCQQILDDVIYPITDPANQLTIEQKDLYHYCYGLLAGELLGSESAQTENWFCCNTTDQTPKINDSDYYGYTGPSL